jgi:hypothetical protein
MRASENDWPSVRKIPKGEFVKTFKRIVANRCWAPGSGAFARRHVTLPSLVPLVLFTLIWPFGGGGNKVHMMAGSATPAAQGTVIARMGSNNNIDVDLKVQSLASPSSLTPPANVYVVWIQPPDHNPQNHGQLSVSQNQNGELHTGTPYKRFQVFVTAEQNAQVQEPEGPKVLQADVSRQ